MCIPEKKERNKKRGRKRGVYITHLDSWAREEQEEAQDLKFGHT
jgi:hypothetical protein